MIGFSSFIFSPCFWEAMIGLTRTALTPTPRMRMDTAHGRPRVMCRCSSSHCIIDEGPHPKSRPRSCFMNPMRSTTAAGSMSWSPSWGAKRCSCRFSSAGTFSGSAVMNEGSGVSAVAWDAFTDVAPSEVMTGDVSSCIGIDSAGVLCLPDHHPVHDIDRHCWALYNEVMSCGEKLRPAVRLPCSATAEYCCTLVHHDHERACEVRLTFREPRRAAVGVRGVLSDRTELRKPWARGIIVAECVVLAGGAFTGRCGG